MTNTQRQNIYDLAKRLDLVIIVGGISYRFINDKLYRIWEDIFGCQLNLLRIVCLVEGWDMLVRLY